MNPRDVLGPMQAEAVEALIAERLAELDARPTEEPWPAYMDAATAARYCSVSVETLRRLLARGVLSRIQEAKGHKLTLARSDLDRLMASWRVEAR